MGGLDRRMSRLRDLIDADGTTSRVALLPTILLVRRAGALEFVDGSVPGISVPAETVERIRSANDQGEAAYALGLEQARFALSLPGVRGIHIADFRRDGSLGRLCADLGLSPRPERESHEHRSAVSV